MRAITAKYDGHCSACGSDIAVGQCAYHERKVGLFCQGCEPADNDELRAYRQQAIDARADRYAERASKRRADAERLVAVDRERMNDIAFVTQPGRMPERQRAIKRGDKAANLEGEAQEMERKATRRKARVKGDAEAAKEAQRELVRQWIEAGMEVRHTILGRCTVVKVSRKTARVRLARTGNAYTEDLIYLSKS